MPPVNTDVMNAHGTITSVVDLDVHARLVRLLKHLIETPGPDGERRSQQSIADATHGKVSQAAISTYLSGTRRAKLEAALAIGKAFGVQSDYFTGVGDLSIAAAMSGETRTVRDRPHDEAIAAFVRDREAAGRPVAPEVVERLRRDVNAWEGILTRDDLVLLLPIAESRAAQLAPAPPPVPEGKRRVPPGRR